MIVPERFISQQQSGAAYLAEQRQRVHQALLHLFLAQKISAAELLKQHSHFVDQLLCEFWPESSAISLIAIGGYGRETLYPYSDLDLLILYRGDSPDQHKLINHFLQQLWDAGFAVGSSIRTIEQCIEDMQRDVEFYTSLLDVRCMAGYALFAQFQHAWQNFDHSLIDFIRAKQTERNRRVNKYHNSLEPDIKESSGGLRELHRLHWLTCYAALIHQEPMSTDEAALAVVFDYLATIRIHLHFGRKRDDNRLLFDEQRQLAQALGFGKFDNKKSVELFMQKFYQHAQTARLACQLAFQLCDERQNLVKAEIRHVNDEFYTKSGYLFLHKSVNLVQEPHHLLLAFLLVAKYHLNNLSVELIETIRNHLYLIDQSFVDQRAHQQVFIKIFSLRHVAMIIKLMADYGVLGAYLPAFAAVRGQMQFDLFHLHTVDQHTLELLQQLDDIREGKHLELKLAYHLCKQQKKLPLLYLAALFHDLGKGRGCDHSQWGAQAVKTFATQHGLSQTDINLLSWLVENHLLLSLTAQKRDISDPQVIAQFSQQVRELEYLDLLFLLTIADMRATNSKLWNGWKQSLVEGLYQAAKQYLSSQEDFHHLANKQQQLKQHFSVEQIASLCQRLPNKYFEAFGVDELVIQLDLYLKNNLPQAVVYNQDEQKTRLCIITSEGINVFLWGTSILERLGLNIVEARFFRTRDHCVISYFTLLNLDGSVLEYRQQKGLVKELLQSLSQSMALTSDSYYHSEYRGFDQTIQLAMERLQEKNQSMISLQCMDSPGVLAQVAQCFDQFNIDLEYAKITTLGNRVDDHFFVSHQQAWLSDSLWQLVKNKLQNFLQ